MQGRRPRSQALCSRRALALQARAQAKPTLEMGRFQIDQTAKTLIFVDIQAEALLGATLRTMVWLIWLIAFEEKHHAALVLLQDAK
jgi:tRNA U38,U39,U40 pseudouridine synthase TruA